MPRHNPADELTDPANEKVLGTLTQRAWKMLNAKAVKARWYADYDCKVLPELLARDNISEALFHQALQTSGSIQGQHRRDLTQAIVGAPPPQTGVSLSVTQPAQDAGAPAEKAKRGI